MGLGRVIVAGVMRGPWPAGWVLLAIFWDSSGHHAVGPKRPLRPVLIQLRCHRVIQDGPRSALDAALNAFDEICHEQAEAAAANSKFAPRVNSIQQALPLLQQLILGRGIEHAQIQVFL